ncbi:GIP, partial [Symbiodinium sp. KB8]
GLRAKEQRIVEYRRTTLWESAGKYLWLKVFLIVVLIVVSWIMVFEVNHNFGFPLNENRRTKYQEATPENESARNVSQLERSNAPVEEVPTGKSQEGDHVEMFTTWSQLHDFKKFVFHKVTVFGESFSYSQMVNHKNHEFMIPFCSGADVSLVPSWLGWELRSSEREGMCLTDGSSKIPVHIHKNSLAAYWTAQTKKAIDVTTGGQTTSHYVNTFDYPGVVKQGVEYNSKKSSLKELQAFCREYEVKTTGSKKQLLEPPAVTLIAVDSWSKAILAVPCKSLVLKADNENAAKAVKDKVQKIRSTRTHSLMSFVNVRYPYSGKLVPFGIFLGKTQQDTWIVAQPDGIHITRSVRRATLSALPPVTEEEQLQLENEEAGSDPPDSESNSEQEEQEEGDEKQSEVSSMSVSRDRKRILEVSGETLLEELAEASRSSGALLAAPAEPRSPASKRSIEAEHGSPEKFQRSQEGAVNRAEETEMYFNMPHDDEVYLHEEEVWVETDDEDEEEEPYERTEREAVTKVPRRCFDEEAGPPEVDPAFLQKLDEAAIEKEIRRLTKMGVISLVSTSQQEATERIPYADTDQEVHKWLTTKLVKDWRFREAVGFEPEEDNEKAEEKVNKEICWQRRASITKLVPILALANNWAIYSVDVKDAFLQVVYYQAKETLQAYGKVETIESILAHLKKKVTLQVEGPFLKEDEYKKGYSEVSLRFLKRKYIFENFELVCQAGFSIRCSESFYSHVEAYYQEAEGSTQLMMKKMMIHLKYYKSSTFLETVLVLMVLAIVVMVSVGVNFYVTENRNKKTKKKRSQKPKRSEKKKEEKREVNSDVDLSEYKAKKEELEEAKAKYQEKLEVFSKKEEELRRLKEAEKLEEKSQERMTSYDEERKEYAQKFDDLKLDYNALKDDLNYYKKHAQDADSTLTNARLKLEDRRQKIRQLKETMGIALTESEKEDVPPEEKPEAKPAEEPEQQPKNKKRGKRGETDKHEEAPKEEAGETPKEESQAQRSQGMETKNKDTDIVEFTNLGYVWMFNKGTQKYKAKRQDKKGSDLIANAPVKGRELWNKVTEVYKEAR